LPESERRTAIETYHFEIIGPSIPILAYDERAAHWHASQRARLSSAGKTPPFADDQIAVIAAVDDLFLITFNTSGYEHFRGIQVEDWRD
jgi:tRNA(fMet)-specific endonuclease VapC